MNVTSADRADVVALVRSGLPVAIEPVTLDDDRARRLVQWSHAARMSSLLRRASEQGEIVMGQEATEEVERGEAAASRRRAALDSGADEALDVLSSCGVEAARFKGAATATALYEPGTRDYNDVDLVVRRDRFEAALDALVADGWSPSHRYRRPAAARRVGASQNLTQGLANVDLHSSIVPLAFGRAAADRALAGEPLEPAALTVASAFDLLLGGRDPKPWAIRDCLQACVAVPHDRLTGLPAEWGLLGPVALALCTAAGAVDAARLLPAWAETTPMRPADVRLFRWYREGPSALLHLEALRRQPGLRLSWAYLRFALPTLGDLRSRGVRDVVRGDPRRPQTGL